MTIRTFQAGDDVAQVSIYNEAAAALPKFKPATLDEARRRIVAADFDPAGRLYALAAGRPVGYITVAASGRLSFPWCRKGHEGHAAPLLQAALDRLRRQGIRHAFAAYRPDWPSVRDFFLAHGFTQAREVASFVMDLVEMPTPAARAGTSVTAITRGDIPALFRIGQGLLRLGSAADLEKHLFDNAYFPPSSVFAVRSQPSGPPLAAGIVVISEAFADPSVLDGSMPCFRLGAFGTEGLTHKRVNGLFSVLAEDSPDLIPHALELLAHANRRAEAADLGSLAAQVPSNAAHLLRFYRSVFRKQGTFPLYEIDL